MTRKMRTTVTLWLALAAVWLSDVAAQEDATLDIQADNGVEVEGTAVPLEVSLVPDDQEDEEENVPAVEQIPEEELAADPLSGRLACTSGYRDFDPLRHKKVYKIGVHAPGGEEAAWREHNITFQDYLTATAGKRFNPPIEFEMVVTTTPLYSWVDVKHDLDFFYSDTGVYSCVGVEAGAQPVATTVSDFSVRGYDFDLDVFAGVIFTRADNHDINDVEDLKNAVIGALEIGDFAGAQVQFYTMGTNGLNYIMDPKQVIFVGNQNEIVRGVARGDWEIGMARTGMLELTRDENGELYDPTMFKVLDTKVYVMDNGQLFPFLHSTPTFPEWPVFATDETPRDVITEVQDALQALGGHRLVGKKIRSCKRDFCAENDCSVNSPDEICDNAPIEYFDAHARCDTTRPLAELAWQAGFAGFHDGFRSPRSYHAVRTMQEAGGFLNKDEFGNWKCTRAETLYGAVICPVGYVRISEDKFYTSCEDSGTPCPEGLDCFCKPCIDEFVVTDYVVKDTGEKVSMADCEQDTVCAEVQQTKTITFKGYDNKLRDDAEVRAVVEVNSNFQELTVVKVGDAEYKFNFDFDMVTVGTLRVFVDDLLIPSMPVYIDIVPRNCKAEYGDRSPDEYGNCLCSSGSFDVNGKCWSFVTLSISIAVIVVFFASVGGYAYLRDKQMRSDQLWLINVEELHFSDPVEVIGQGAFGVVLSAEYRGTKVAIKRVIKPKKKGVSGSVDIDRNSSFQVQSMGENSVFTDEGSADVDVEQAQGLDSQDFDKETEKSEEQQQGTFQLDFLTGSAIGAGRRSVWQQLCPALAPSEEARAKFGMLDSKGMSSNTTRGLKGVLCPCWDKATQQKQEFMAEMRLLSRLRHPYITTVMGAVVSHWSDPMLVMEFMEYGSLHDLLRNETMYTGGDVILQIVRDIAQGLRYLHASKPPILHGDLKARNILIDARFRAKVADFGLSTKKKNGLTGTPYFMAPEYLRGKTDYTAPCDIYALGVIFFEIYAREDPYKGENMKQVLMKVCNPSTNKRPRIPDAMPPKFVEITKKCWSADPFYRPQAKDLDLLFMDMNQRDAEPLTRDDMHGKGEKKSTFDMLYEVFPRHIADALKEGRKVEPEQHDCVTIFFSDIVGFTTISRKLSPSKVCDMLERLYEAFDRLARAHKVFKVETIGDAYMGVTNLDGSQEDEHVKNIAEFAVEAIDAARKVLIDTEDPSIGHVRIRVGFHSGPVVSNVIGSLNPRYGLFGDTVNTASRMESSSFAGKIHCSEKSAKLLMEQAPKMRLRRRGKVAIKGKGDMLTYWVQAPKSGSDFEPTSEQAPNQSTEFAKDSSQKAVTQNSTVDTSDGEPYEEDNYDENEGEEKEEKGKTSMHDESQHADFDDEQEHEHDHSQSASHH